jgi:uncharacterized protein
MRIDRRLDESRFRDALRESPVVLLTGPRQVGKSRLARTIVTPDAAHLFDLEDPRDVARLADRITAIPAADLLRQGVDALP